MNMINTPQEQQTGPRREEDFQGPYMEDEISIHDIWRVLVQQKIWILSITVLAVIGSVVIALTVPPVYRAESFLLPPLSFEIEAFNVPEVNEVTADDIYQEMLSNLRSNSLRRRFFDEHKLADILSPQGGKDVSEDEVFQDQFNDMMNLQQGKGEMSHFVTLTLDGKDPMLASDWLNGFVALANEYTTDNIIKGIKKKLELRRADTLNRIEVMRNYDRQRRMDRIAALDEALGIARNLGIKERSGSPTIAVNKETNSAMGVAINMEQLPLYLNGVKELTAEKEALENRKSDDPFNPNIRVMQEKLSRLERIDLNFQGVKAARIDQQAIPPDTHIKPKRTLIVLLGGVIGLMLGFFIAFVRNVVAQQKAANQQP